MSNYNLNLYDMEEEEILECHSCGDSLEDASESEKLRETCTNCL